MGADGALGGHRVSAVLLAFNRPEALANVLRRLDELPVDEVVVVDNGGGEAGAVAGSWGGKVRRLAPGANLGIAGRNRGAEVATGDLIVFLEDDSYPLPGAVESLVDLFDRLPRLGVAGGLVRDVGPGDEVLLDTEPGTFDWWLRAGASGDPPPAGFPACFFPEGACMVRRDAFLDAGGFYEPYFFTVSEIDLATRLLARGWDVRYLPTAAFAHEKGAQGRPSLERVLGLRVRNQLWYFWLRFPAGVAVRRMLAYGLFDLLNACYRGVPRAWPAGVLDAWRGRDLVRADRAPVPRQLLGRVELRRGRMHLRLLATRLGELVAGGNPARRRRSDPWAHR